IQDMLGGFDLSDGLGTPGNSLGKAGMYRRTGRQSRQTDRRTDRQRGGRTDGRTDRQTDRQTDYCKLNPAQLTPPLKNDAFDFSFQISSTHFKTNSRGNHFVYLQAISQLFNLEKVIVVSSHPGYMFIQTDKPVYFPRDKGESSWRGLWLSFGADASLPSCTGTAGEATVVSWKMIFVLSVREALKLIFPSVFLSRVGVWKLVAKFVEITQKNYTTEFEVKEYVLYIVLEVICLLLVLARYFHGNKEVKGYAYVMFGLLVDDEKRSLPDSLQSIEIEDGRGTARLTRQQILRVFPDINRLIDQSIYVSATVLTPSGSDKVEAEIRGIKVVTSPYKVLFTRTPKYFMPGFPFHVMVLVTNPDGSPASNVDLEGQPGNILVRTNRDGTAIMIFNTVQDRRNLVVTVRTKSLLLAESRQAEGRMEAVPYQTQSNSSNYLHIYISSAQISAGSSLQINLNIQTNDVLTQETIKYISYLITNKGSLIKAGRQQRPRGQTFISMWLPIERQMIPSFRFVAYYYVTTGGTTEIVSDSVWVDVEDSCIGTLQVTPGRGGPTYSPGRQFSFKLRGDPGARVELMAVNKAMFALNNKNKLTQTKIWDLLEKNDIGCTPGRGQNNMGVFSDAGLIFVSNVNIGTPFREGEALTFKACMLQKWCKKVCHYLPNCFTPPAFPFIFSLVVKEVRMFLKDSVTTWEILAVSLSSKGICVADPYEITVKKDFFIDLRLPYSAVLYNYYEEDIEVRVEWTTNKQLCSKAIKNKHSETVSITRQSSQAVSFIIIPLRLGRTVIEVKAFGRAYGEFVADGVKKQLNVVVNILAVSLIAALGLLLCAGGVQTEFIPKMDVQSTETPENAINASRLIHLIRRGYGTAETTMMAMTATVIVTHYLDKSNQWDRVGVRRRAEAIDYITVGKLFVTCDNSDSPTRLTAHVVKVFTMAYTMISVDETVICSALRWLIINKQFPDGFFKEDSPTVHGEMVGGQRNSESVVTLTAFVLIALAESRELCRSQVPALEASIEKAATFLNRRLPTLQKPYTVAISSYALALCGRILHDSVLMTSASPGEARSEWQTSGSTGYALLASVKTAHFDRAGKIVRWLTGQEFYGTGYGTTQANIIVFQAITEYLTTVQGQQEIDLDVELSTTELNRPFRWRINMETAHLSRSAVVKAVGLHSQNQRAAVQINSPLISTLRIWYHGERDATMSVLDISMLTGFIVDQTDLQKLASAADRNIQKVEVDKVLSNKASLILYLDKHSEVISIKVHKMFKVGFIQPAAVTIYEYYDSDKRCQRFYNPEEKSALLSKICYRDVCKCAEGNTSLPKDLRGRHDKRCSPLWNVLNSLISGVLRAIRDVEMVTAFLCVASLSADLEQPEGQKRHFFSPSSCKKTLNLETNKDYLITGHMEDWWHSSKEIYYFIGSDTWIEWWPSAQDCQDPRYKKTCEDIKILVDGLTAGCQS
uniref:NTR domain-containing protein n=1 Tax=Erpetoichthys calabaricus TaxID=27687 RepID=A0A8C4XFV3_ERPCA